MTTYSSRNVITTDQDNGRIGIGTTPLDTLHVNGGLRLQDGTSLTHYEESGSISIIFDINTSTPQTWKWNLVRIGDIIQVRMGDDPGNIVASGGTISSSADIPADFRPDGSKVHVHSLAGSVNGTFQRFLLAINVNGSVELFKDDGATTFANTDTFSFRNNSNFSYLVTKPQ